MGPQRLQRSPRIGRPRLGARLLMHYSGAHPALCLGVRALVLAILKQKALTRVLHPQAVALLASWSLVALAARCRLSGSSARRRERGVNGMMRDGRAQPIAC